jgi:hypothetical protein
MTKNASYVSSDYYALIVILLFIAITCDKNKKNFVLNSKRKDNN